MTPRYRHRLPQQQGEMLLADGGIETTLIFHEGFDLPEFASFPLLDSLEGRAALERYFLSYIEVARRQGVGLVLDTPTWRASWGWGRKVGYDATEIERVNRDAVAFVAGLRDVHAPADTPVVVSGGIGPRGDGYVVGTQMTVEEAEEYHRPQIAALADAGVDLVSIITMPYAEEAIGAVRAARAVGVPIVVAFTVETDGRLPSGEALGDAIERSDAATDGYAVSYGVNCAHPDHFSPVLVGDAPWLGRIGLVRANASRMSHEELDQAEQLDAGDPEELGGLYRELQRRLPGLSVVGGCCGTDHTHIEQIGRHTVSERAALSR